MSHTSSSSNGENSPSNNRIGQPVLCEDERQESEIAQGDTLVVWTPQETTEGSLESSNQESELLYLVDSMENDTLSNERVSGDGTTFIQSSTFPVRVSAVPDGNSSENLLPAQFCNPVRVPMVSTGTPCKNLGQITLSNPVRVPIVNTGSTCGSLDPTKLRNPMSVTLQQNIPGSANTNIVRMTNTPVQQCIDIIPVTQGSVPLADIIEQGSSVRHTIPQPADSSRFYEKRGTANPNPSGTNFESGSSFTIKTMKQLHSVAQLKRPQGRFADNVRSVYFKPDQSQEVNKDSPSQVPKFQLGEQCPKSVPDSPTEPKPTPYRIIRVCTTNTLIGTGTVNVSSINHCTTTHQDCGRQSFTDAIEGNSSIIGLVTSSQKEHGKVQPSESSSVDNHQRLLGTNAPKHILVCFMCNESLPDKISLEEHLSQHGVSIISSSDKSFVLAAKTPIVVKCKESSNGNPSDRTELSAEHSYSGEKMSGEGSGRLDSDVGRASNSLPGRPVPTGKVSKEAFCCLVCNISCSNRRLLDQHMRSHTGERPFTCPICSKAFSQKSTLTVHQRQHTGEHPFQCEYCPRKFKQRGNYNVHLRGHTGECPFQCSECGKKFKRSRNLKQHFRTHTGEKPFECEICQMKFTTKNALQKHAQMHTSTPKVSQPSFECPVCNVSFTTKGSLNTHARTHTGAHPFSCSECNKKFSTQSALSVHSKTHSGERPFPCQLCSMRFKQKIHLTVHIRTHTGEKPYKCSVCEYRCAQKSLLTTHIKSHSGSHPEAAEGITKRGSHSCPSCPFVCTKSDNMAQHVTDCHNEDKGEDRVISYEGRALIKEAELLASEAKDLIEKAEASEKRAAKLLNQAKKIRLKAMTIEETARTDALEKLARKKEREPCEEEIYEEEDEERFLSQEVDSKANTTDVS